MATYSVRIAWVITASSSTVVYTVPVGITSVLRDIEVFNGTATVQDIRLQISLSGPAQTAIAFNALAPADHLQWEGRVVLPVGAQLWAFSSNGGISVVISGYELGS